MSDIKIQDIKRLVAKIHKVHDVDTKSYHKRLSLAKTMSSPTVDIKITRTSGPFSSVESLEISYSCDVIFTTIDKNDIESVIQLIKSKEKELKNDIITKKKQDFLKLIED